MSAAVCECGHGKSDHVLLSRECRNPDPVAEDCVCTKFRAVPKALVVAAEAQTSEAEPLAPGCREMPTRTCPALYGAQGCKPPTPCARFESDDETPWLADTESTSARLARVTAERDAAKQSLAEALDRADDAERECAEALAKRDQMVEMGNVWIRAAREAQSLAEGFRRTIGELTAERDEARSWLVARDDGLDCLRCGNSIYRGEAHEAMPASGGRQHVHCPHNQPPAEVIERREQWWCTTCGSRYRVNDLDHEHLPLKRVVTVTTAR